jgi:hypothetical protein
VTVSSGLQNPFIRETSVCLRLGPTIGRLAEIEVDSINNPNVFRLYTIAHVYGLELPELLSWYGIPKH